MKILHINAYDRGGGAHNLAFSFIEKNENHFMLVDHKFGDHNRVDVLAESPLSKIFTLLDKIVWKLGWKRPFRVLFSIQDEFHYSYRRLKRHPWYSQCDIIHLHNLHGSFFNLRDLEKIVKDKEIVWTLHDMWAFSGGETYFVKNDDYKEGLPTKGSSLLRYYPLYSPLLDRRRSQYKLKKSLYRRISSNISFVPCSNWLKGCFAESYAYDSSLQVKTIRVGSDEKVFTNNGKRTWSKPRIAIVSTSIFYKGSKIFHNFFSRFDESLFDLYVIGSDEDFDFGSLLVTHFSYFKTKEELSEFFNNVDYLIFPSLLDNCPLMVSEAMLCGVHVIGPNVSGVKEQIENCGGLLYDSENKEDLERVIRTLPCQLDNHRKEKFTISESAVKNYSFSSMFAEYNLLYNSIKTS